MEKFKIPPVLRLEPKADDPRTREAEATVKIGAILKEFRCQLVAPVAIERGPDGWFRATAPQVKVVAEK